MERSIEEIIGDNEEISEDTEDTEDTEEQPTQKPVVSEAIQRPKKERTQKQKDALEKAREARSRNIAAKKAQKSEAPMVQKKPLKQKKKKAAPRVVYMDASESSSDEEPPPIVIKRKKKKKKKAPVYVEESESSESSDGEYAMYNDPPAYEPQYSNFRFV